MRAGGEGVRASKLCQVENGRDKIMDKVLIVDDDAPLASELASLLAGEFMVAVLTRARDAITVLSAERVSAVILETDMDTEEGEDVFTWALQHCPKVEVIVHTRSANLKDAVGAIKLGAADYIPKPGRIGRVVEGLRSAVKKRGAPRRHPRPQPVETSLKIGLNLS